MVRRHHCGGSVKLVQACFCAREDRESSFKCEEISRKQFSGTAGIAHRKTSQLQLGCQ